ncbi:MAG: hypothetical protein ACREQY_01350, partial [Candidatus Binatia bacterium]
MSRNANEARRRRAGRAALSAVLLLGLPAAARGDSLRAGFGVRSIVPSEELLAEVWHTAGGKHPTGVLPGDGLWARAAYLESNGRKLVIVSLDLLGLFHDDVVRIRDGIRAGLAPDVEVLVASTHTHSSIDTLGIYGPDEVTTGVNPDYQAFLRGEAVAAGIDAAAAAVPASLWAAEQPAPSGLNEYDINRHPGSFDDGVHVLQFLDSSEATIGTIVNWASHPELIDPDSGSDPAIPPGGVVLSSDYVHTLRTRVEQSAGGTALFLNGPIGAVTALAMPIVDPETNEPFPRRSVAKAYYVGREIGTTALLALASNEVIVDPAPSLEIDSVVFDLPVDNPFILALKAAQVLPRQTYAFGVPVPFGREVRTEMMRVRLGPVELVSVPGELHPDVYTGGYLPREERANPDVPPERPIRPQMGAPIHFVVGLGQDELGYFVSATDFVRPSTISPVYGEGVDRHGHDHYQETLSLGRDTARSVGQQASILLGEVPEPDYLPFVGGFLDEDGKPLY